MKDYKKDTNDKSRITPGFKGRSPKKWKSNGLLIKTAKSLDGECVISEGESQQEHDAFQYENRLVVFDCPEIVNFWRKEYFIMAIEKLEPELEVLKALSYKPLNAYRVFIRDWNRWNYGIIEMLLIDKQDNHYEKWKKLLKDLFPKTQDFKKKEEEFLEFRETLEAWAESFNINKLWILRRAFTTVMHWRIIEERCGKLGRDNCTYRHFHGYKSPNYSRMNISIYPLYNEENFIFPLYDPMTENAAGFEERAVERFRNYLERYIEKVENYYQTHATRKPAKNDDRLHCEWQVRRVIQKNLGLKQIAKNCGVSINTFNDGTKNKFRNTDIPNEKRK